MPQTYPAITINKKRALFPALCFVFNNFQIDIGQPIPKQISIPISKGLMLMSQNGLELFPAHLPITVG